jgi:hypothetical protein
MEIRTNATGDTRKKLVGEISRHQNAPTKYLGMPTAAYEVGDYTIDKQGTVTGPDNLDLTNTLRDAGFTCEISMDAQPAAEPPKRKGIMETLLEALNEDAEDGEHWTRLHTPPTIIDECGREHNLDGTFASAANAETPDTITIELPFTSCGDMARWKENLAALLQSKATLIKKALGEDGMGSLPIEFTDSTVKFEWLRFGTDSDVVTAWSAFLAAAVKFSKTAKRVTAKDGAVENEKFHFRAFLVRIGMNDITNKVHRKTLLRGLSGDAAFATVESKERWLAKHGTKKNAEEVAVNAE